MPRSRSIALALLLPAAAFAEAPLGVEVVTVEVAPAIQEFTLVGIVSARTEYPASFRASGLVTDIYVEVGDHVAAGETIARLDQTTAKAQFDAAVSNRDAATARQIQAEQARDRAQGLLERGAGTQATVDEAVQAYHAAQSGLLQAEIQLEKAQQALDDTVITAVEDVIVTQRSATEGEIIAAGTAIVDLATERELESTFYVPDHPIVSHAHNMPIRIEPLDGGETFIARISDIAPVVSAAGTVTITAALPDNAALAIGTIVEGKVELTSEPFFKLPADALTISTEGPAVWIVDPATSAVHLSPVTIGAYRNGSVDVSEGVHAGDMVVGKGSHSLYEGRLVTATVDTDLPASTPTATVATVAETTASPRPVTSEIVAADTAQQRMFTGIIQPHTASDLAFRVAGRLAHLDVQAGDRVSAGQVIASLDQITLEQDLAAARAAVDAATAAADFANQQFTRAAELVQRGVYSQAQMEQAKANNDAAQAQLETANATMREAEEYARYSRLTATADGIVLSTSVEVGTVVSAGQPILEVSPIDGIEAVIDIPEAILSVLPSDAEFRIMHRIAGIAPVTARLTLVEPVTEGKLDTRRLRLTLVDPSPDWRIGALVTALPMIEDTPIVTLPVAAIIDRDGTTGVWRVTPARTAEFAPVTLGQTLDDQIVITGGLGNGDEVITRGVHSIVVGQPIGDRIE